MSKPMSKATAIKTLDQVSVGSTALQWHVEMKELEKLKPSPHNARTHSKKQIQQIAKSISRFGLINPIIVDRADRIVAGHGRAAASKLLNLSHVPVILVSNLSEAELRAYALADNRLSESSGWDRSILAIEFRELAQFNIDLDVTGFGVGEIDLVLGDAEADEVAEPNEIPEPRPTAVSRSGDVFKLGAHRLAVGDARDKATYARLMDGQLATMAFLDPPYNVKVNGHVGGRGKTKHREFACASGEMDSGEFTCFLEMTLGNCAAQTADGGINYVCMDWRHCREVLKAGLTAYNELKNICVWTKTTPGQGTFYRSQHEFVFVYKVGTAQHLNSFELGQHGRTRTNVWNYPGANSFRAGRLDELRMHPTVKPVALVADAMRDCSRRGSVVLDAFCGSGTTIVAAEQLGRRAFCIEIDPVYADVTIRRWQILTRRDALLEHTGQTFDELEIGGRSPRFAKRQIRR